MAFQISSTAFQFSSMAFRFPRNPRKSIYGEKYTKDCYSSFVFFATCSPSFVIPAKQYLHLTQHWHTVVHMPKMLTWKLKIYCRLHFLLDWRTPNETKSEGFPWAMHSGLYASFLGIIHGRANYSSDESHLQQANVIQDWGNDMQVEYWWHSTGWKIVHTFNRRFWANQGQQQWQLECNYKMFLKSNINIMQSYGPHWTSSKWC